MQLESCSKIIGTLREIPKDAAIAIADHSRFIYYQPGESIDIRIKPGEKLREGTVSLQALMYRKTVSTLVDERKSVFGVSYFATGYPIIKGKQVEGVVTAIFPPRLKDNYRQPFLVGRKEDLWIPVPFHEIIYLSAENGKTWIHTNTESYQTKYSLSQLEYRLPVDQFIRTHRSYIVRLNAIAEIHPHFHSTFLLIMKDRSKSRVPVSQNASSDFRNKLGF